MTTTLPREGKSLDGKDSSPISVKLSSHRFMDTPVYIQVIQMTGTLFVWIGGKEPTLDNLTIALTSRLDGASCSSSVVGEGEDDTFRTAFARKLALRTGMVIHLSYNLPPNRDFLEAFVQKQIIEILKKSGVITAKKSTTANANKHKNAKPLETKESKSLVQDTSTLDRLTNTS
ncbi:hypothetical protein AAMO2058_001172000 [Amorphochlora amoebiformis]